MSVLYVAYDGALDPLGGSQVVPYVAGLASRGCAITLITFEKAERWRDTVARTAMAFRLGAADVRWCPLAYHRRPRLAATLADMLAGIRVVAAEARRSAPVLVHCRGDVATAMARWSGGRVRSRLLYDVRGLFSDERVDAGSWRRGSLLDRFVRRIEAGNLRRADGVVVLTGPAADELRRRRPSLPLVRVIPTCTDLTSFTPRAASQKAEFGLTYIGSLGTWYMGAEMVAFAAAAREFVPGPPLFLTPHADEARRLGATADWAEVRAVTPGEVASWLRRASALFFFIRPVRSKRASCPTKFAEGLASGLPIVCNRGIGDLDDVVEAEGVGVLVDGFSDAAYREAGRRLRVLLQDPGLSDRCRGLAEDRYSLAQGVDAYADVYRKLGVAAVATSGKREQE